MQSKEADPHDIVAIESILSARADRAPPLAHDPHGGPHLNIAPEISVGSPIPRIEPGVRLDDAEAGAVATIPPDDIKVDDAKSAGQPPSRWGRRVVMALLALVGAMGAAAWQHYGDHAKDNAKAIAANWTPAFVMAALMPAEKSAAAAPQASGEAEAQAAVPVPAETAAAAAPLPEATQLQSMAHDLAAMGQQVEELKATIAQLKASQAQLTRDLAKSQEAKAVEAKAAAPRIANAAPPAGSPMTAAAALPRQVAAAPPPPTVRKPKPVAPAQAAYVPPPPVQLQSAPQQALADDGAPLVRPPMPLR